MEKLIGAPIDRIDGRLEVMGAAPYSYEHKVPDAVYAVMVTSTIANGASPPLIPARQSARPASCWS